ncbi:hypothetical protein PG997_008473 [Apiospora hydei]|uniref:Secreted protein n=1 Tax=Apiospora hydei TaxID=1337664 RepID=A0ABR1WAX5_9PEZI
MGPRLILSMLPLSACTTPDTIPYAILRAAPPTKLYSTRRPANARTHAHGPTAQAVGGGQLYGQHDALENEVQVTALDRCGVVRREEQGQGKRIVAEKVGRRPLRPRSRGTTSDGRVQPAQPLLNGSYVLL